jgi:branched-subunit amino acid transport protein
MTNWQIIVLAGAASYLIRSVPIVLFNKRPMSSDGLLYKYLNYAALSVMGGIIYTALYGQAAHSSANITQLFAQLVEPHNLLKLATVLLALLLTAWKRKVFVSLLSCMGFYYGLRLLIAL